LGYIVKHYFKKKKCVLKITRKNWTWIDIKWY
jgi:hypothetical protein